MSKTNQLSLVFPLILVEHVRNSCQLGYFERPGPVGSSALLLDSSRSEGTSLYAVGARTKQLVLSAWKVLSTCELYHYCSLGIPVIYM